MRVEILGCILCRCLRRFINCECGRRFISRTALHFESSESLTKIHLLDGVDHWRRIVVALHPPDPVVWTVLEIADSTMGIAHRPASDQDLAEVSGVIAVSVFHINRGLTVLNNHAAAYFSGFRKQNDAQ